MSGMRIEDMLKALDEISVRLEDVLSRDYEEDDVILDAAVRRFKTTSELSWKVMKHVMKVRYNREASNPRKAISVAKELNIIVDEIGWMKILDDKIKLTTDYEEAVAIFIIDRVKNEHLDLIKSLQNALRKEVNQT